MNELPGDMVILQTLDGDVPALPVGELYVCAHLGVWNVATFRALVIAEYAMRQHAIAAAEALDQLRDWSADIDDATRDADRHRFREVAAAFPGYRDPPGYRPSHAEVLRYNFRPRGAELSLGHSDDAGVRP